MGLGVVRWLLVSVVLLVGCGVLGGESDPALVSDDQELARELLAGWLAPEEMFEVRDVSCVKLDTRVSASATIVNLNDFPWAFGVEMVFTTVDGEVIPQRTDQGFWEPGQAVEISQWVGGTDFDDPPLCEVVVYHGATLAFRDTELKARTYERLGWDPFTESRIED